MSPTTATLKGQIWLLRSVKASYHGSEVPQLTEPSKKPTPQSVFSFQRKVTPDLKAESRATPRDGYATFKNQSCIFVVSPTRFSELNVVIPLADNDDL